MRNNTTFMRFTILLCLIGILISGWLLSVHIKFSTGQAGLTEGCGIFASAAGHGCANVAVSDYSDVFGIPLAAIAMSFYFSLLILVFWAMRNLQAAYEALYVSFFLSTISIIVTVVMFYISRFVIGSFCIGCTALWLINLSIWPCLVKQLGLSWGSALAGNLELIRHRKMNLKRSRIVSSLTAAVISLLIFSVIGATAKGLSKEPVEPGSSIEQEYNSAQQVFLPTEAIGGDQSKGTQNSPVMEIIEFSDLQCPACKMAAKFFRPFLMKHADKVRFSYRHFPLDGSCNPYVPNGMHMFACAAAKATICAAKQNKFWDLHDMIFDNQDDLSNSLIEELAEKVGLDMPAYKTCLASPETENQLQKEIKWGDMVDLNSTPTIIINGRKLVGAHSPADLEILLKALEKK